MIARVVASRKFMTAILGALLVALNDALDLGLREDTMRHIVMILTGWLVGESAIDAASAWSNGRNGHHRPPAPPQATPHE